MIGSWTVIPDRVLAGASAALAIALLLALALAGVAHGKSEYEPNDSRPTAAGPLAGGTAYTATRETDNDVNWYLFYVKTYSQMDFWATMDKYGTGCEGSSRTHMRLFDKDGEYLDAESLDPDSTDVTDHLLITLSPGRYYIKVSETSRCTEERYTFGINPASALTSSRDCGEAIIAKDAAAPELEKVNGLLANNGGSLAKVDEVLAKAGAQLTAITRQWRKLKRRWTRNGRRINRSRRSGYRKRVARRNLRYSKRKANQRLAAAKRRPKAKLEKANATHESILAKRAELEALSGQHAAVVSNADLEIAAHC